MKECPLQRHARDEAVELLADDCALLTQQRASNANLYGTKTFNEALDDALARATVGASRCPRPPGPRCTTASCRAVA